MKKKTGFSMAELILVVLIIGICIVVAMTTVKPGEKKAVRYLYMNAYSALSKAYYNAALIGYNPFTDEVFDGIEVKHTDSEDSGALILCRGLTYYINTTTNGSNDYSTSCSATKLTSANANEFLDSKIQFIANNGMKFYISKMLGDDDVYFYLVFVDVNGNKYPNTPLYTSRGDYDLEPDIYAFAVLDTGRVCPIGPPEYDTNILTARYGYYDNDSNTLYSNKSLAYYQAKGAAWGFYNNASEPVDYNADEVFSMNDIIRTKIKNSYSNSLLIKDFPDLYGKDPISVDNDHNCSTGDLESCFIFLDSYRY